MLRGLSLAKKCLLLFGGAIVLIVLAALSVPWLRMMYLIDDGQLEVSRQQVDTWQRLGPEAFLGPPRPGPWVIPSLGSSREETRAGIEARELTVPQAERDADPFVQHALAFFREHPNNLDYQEARWRGTSREYQYARAVWRAGDAGTELAGLIELDRRSVSATRMVMLNTAFLLIAGAVVLALALLVFWIITRALVLSPVERLRVAAERVRQGNLSERPDIGTGDEFQELAETFNVMLADLQASQDRLRAINAAMDVKLHELSEANSALFQAAKMKDEFLAGVSHELRTPLNSINGFAELLLETAKADAELPDPPPSAAKRVRYLENILNAGRGLLALINSLLEMARIEAGRVDVRAERMSVREACEGLLGLISPQANKKGIVLKLEVAEDVPSIVTDPRKFQQVIFNFLSNAVKFTPPAGMAAGPARDPVVVLRAERLPAAGAGERERVRVSVIDNGPGIAKEEQDKVFEKFYQVGGGYSREQSGTGLGLAICKDLAQLLGAEIQLVSDLNRGAMFSLILPLSIEESVGEPDAARERVLEDLRERGEIERARA
ncbi:MAG TPA: HAMP domain-containing sensor histidine kinase [Phycisphaerales bacterium]|nr:HAMP domain-containing sensor histidine kinase [Phycisphaerales bacterium]